MWKQYQKTMIPIQLAIFGICIFLNFTGRTTPGATLIIFAVMQVSAVLGAWWGLRLKRKIEGNPEKLPLE